VADQTLSDTVVGDGLAKELDRDLGFGSVVAGQSRERLLNMDGSFNVRRTGLPFFASINSYHTLLTMSWTRFLTLVLLLYFLSNILFGLIYASIGGWALVDTSSEPMMNVFMRGFFSACRPSPRSATGQFTLLVWCQTSS
jgi:hypothetical protein